MFAGHGSDSDSDDEFSQAELNLNESIPQLELGKDTVMNLAKCLYDQISGAKEKSSSAPSAGILVDQELQCHQIRKLKRNLK